jgi:hypothetical protein
VYRGSGKSPKINIPSVADDKILLTCDKLEEYGRRIGGFYLGETEIEINSTVIEINRVLNELHR